MRLARKARQVLPAQLVQQVPRDRKAHRACQAWQEPLGRKAQRGQLVQQEQLEQLERRATLD